MYSCKLPRLRPTSSQDHGLQVHLQSCSITASKLAQSWPPSASANSLDHGLQCASPTSLDYALQVHIQTGMITASKLGASWSPSVSPNLHNSGIQVHLQTSSITFLECISKFIWSRPLSVSPNPLDYHLQVNFQPRSLMALQCISEFTRPTFSGTPWIAQAPPAASLDISCIGG